jgi:hypothetical protein
MSFPPDLLTSGWVRRHEGVIEDGAVNEPGAVGLQ